MSEKPDRLDVVQLAASDLPESDFPAQGKHAFRVYIDGKIHDRIAAHAAEKLSLEICGVLLGHWQRDDNGPFVLVNEAIRADKAQSNAGDVTFTHEAWNEIHHEMDTKFTDWQIVGWYHSHPDFGIFLSDRDCFIHEHFFNSPGQIAYVVDPVNGVEGVFCWRNGKAKLYPHFWVGDEIHLSSQGKERQPSSTPTAENTAPQATTPAPPPPAASTLTWLLAAACLLLLGYLVGGMRTAADRLQSELGAVAQYGLFKGLRPGLHENLDTVQHNMQAIAQAVDKLSREHVAAAGDAAEEKKKQWNEVLQALVKTSLDVQKINVVYSLAPEEAAAVQDLINQKEAETANVRIPPGEAAKSSGTQSSPKSTAEPAAKPTAEKPALPKPTAEKSAPAAH